MKTKLTLILAGTILALLTPAHSQSIPAQPVTDINPAGDSNPENITFSRNRLYFTATDRGGVKSIYSKLLVTGRFSVADPVLNRRPTLIRRLVRRGAPLIADNFVRSFETNVGDKMFFHVRGEGLYVTGGTALSTIPVLRFNSLRTREGFSFDPGVTPYNTGGSRPTTGVVFAGQTARNGVEPFVSIGRPGARFTYLVRDINPGPNGSFPYDFCALPSGDLPDQIFFGAFSPTSFYQLYRSTRLTPATTAVSIVSRTDSLDNNVETAPYGFSLAGNNVVFGGGNDVNDLNTEIGLFDTSNNTVNYLTASNVNPSNIVGGFGNSAYFSGTDSTFGREVWIAGSFGSAFANNYENIVPGPGSSDPINFRTFGGNTYYLANDGAGYHLYRAEGNNSVGKIVTTGNANITVVDDYVAALDSTGSGPLYFIGDDGTGKTLWTVDNQFGTVQATQVRTGQGNVIKNPSNLGTATNLTGATSINRVYFRANGVDTEFAGRGSELWVYQD